MSNVLSEKQMKQLESEVRELIVDRMSNATTSELEDFVNTFEDTFKSTMNVALLTMQNEYYQTPCEDCWNGCAEADRLYYCPRNT